MERGFVLVLCVEFKEPAVQSGVAHTICQVRVVLLLGAVAWTLGIKIVENEIIM